MNGSARGSPSPSTARSSRSRSSRPSARTARSSSCPKSKRGRWLPGHRSGVPRGPHDGARGGRRPDAHLPGPDSTVRPGPGLETAAPGRRAHFLNRRSLGGSRQISVVTMTTSPPGEPDDALPVRPPFPHFRRNRDGRVRFRERFAALQVGERSRRGSPVGPRIRGARLGGHPPEPGHASRRRRRRAGQPAPSGARGLRGETGRRRLSGRGRGDRSTGYRLREAIT